VKVVVSGHRGLDDEVTLLIEAALREHLSGYRSGELIGLTLLADGADQIFARAVLERGGALHVVVPSEDYREGLPQNRQAEYDALLARASSVQRLDHERSTPDAHMHASRRIVDQADDLVALWDGQPARPGAVPRTSSPTPTSVMSPSR
jgi:hypothetical protein